MSCDCDHPPNPQPNPQQVPQPNPQQVHQKEPQIEPEISTMIYINDDSIECITEAKKLRNNVDVTQQNYTHGLPKNNMNYFYIKTGYHALIQKNKNIVTNGVTLVIQVGDTIVYGNGTRPRNTVIEIDGDILMEDFTQNREGVLYTRQCTQKFRHIGGKKIKFPVGTEVTFYRNNNIIGQIDKLGEEITCETIQ